MEGNGGRGFKGGGKGLRGGVGICDPNKPSENCEVVF